MRRNPRAGVTLIELLIAVTLMGLLAGGILMSLHVGMKTMERTQSRLMANRRVIGASRILEQEIAGLMPVGALCVNPGGPAPRVPFFQGEPQAMRFVSSYSIQEAYRGYPRILEFTVIPGDLGNGVRLVVNEHLYAGPLSTGMFCFGVGVNPATGGRAPLFHPIQTGAASFILADKLAYCRFIYKELLPPPGVERWTPYWSNMMQWPSAVRIEMAPIRPDASSLQMSNVTIPIRVDSEPLKPVVDY
jgi:general secretion pathway protein J